MNNYINVDKVCSVMTDAGVGDPLQRIGQINSMILREHRQKKMNFHYATMLKEQSNTSLSSMTARFGARQWLYQVCYQLGFFQTTTSKLCLFGGDNDIPVDFYVNQCRHVFGQHFSAESIGMRLIKTNVDYGGLRPKAKHVLSVQGTADPWHSVGVTHSLENSVQAIRIQGTAHCANVYPASAKDSEHLTEARKQVRQFLYEMIKGGGQDDESNRSGVGNILFGIFNVFL